MVVLVVVGEAVLVTEPAAAEAFVLLVIVVVHLSHSGELFP